MEKNKVKIIYKLIENKKYDEARTILEELYARINKNYTYKIDYLKGLIDESEKDYLNRDSVKSLKKEKFLLLGNKSYEEKEYEQAIEYYQEGLNQTKHPIFQYHLALCYYKLENYSDSIIRFKNYIDKGYEMLDIAYYYLAEIYAILVEQAKVKRENELVYTNIKYAKKLKKSDMYLSKYHTYTNIKNGDLFHNGPVKIKEKSVKLITKDNEVEELISKGKLNDVIDIYNETNYSRKVTILALLYMNGFDKLADKIYRKDKDILQKECSSEIKQLNKNKTLYKMKKR